MVKLTAYGHVKDGVLTLSHKTRYDQDLSTFKDCAVEITIKKRGTRSSQANRYLWGVVYKELEVRLRELGNDVNPEVVHEFCKGKFNAEPIVGIGGEQIDTKGGSTTEMNSYEFTEYVDKIIRFAAEYLEITIPLPGQVLQFNF